MSSKEFDTDFITTQNNGIPVKEVLMLAGAIAYFVLPVDIIPDFVAGVGYTDDLAALTAAFKAAQKIFSSVAKDKAVGKAAEIFGDKFDADRAVKIVSGEITKHNK